MYCLIIANEGIETLSREQVAAKLRELIKKAGKPSAHRYKNTKWYFFKVDGVPHTIKTSNQHRFYGFTRIER